MRRKIQIGRLTRKAWRMKIKRTKEAEERNRIQMQKIKYKISNETKNKLSQKLKQNKSNQEKKESTEDTTEKNNTNCDGLGNWQENFVTRLGITVSEDEEKIQPPVKQEPFLESDEFDDDHDEHVQNNIEVSKEIKIEYDCETDADAITSIQPILIKEPQNELTLKKPNDDKTVTQSKSGSKFSKKPPIKTKEEALRFIKLLESFALNKENIRLIGFIERLQNHFEKKP